MSVGGLSHESAMDCFKSDVLSINSRELTYIT